LFRKNEPSIVASDSKTSTPAPSKTTELFMNTQSRTSTFAPSEMRKAPPQSAVFPTR